jgi:hypothetical protein
MGYARVNLVAWCSALPKTVELNLDAGPFVAAFLSIFLKLEESALSE